VPEWYHPSIQGQAPETSSLNKLKLQDVQKVENPLQVRHL
jgi:hypothetical protein